MDYQSFSDKEYFSVHHNDEPTTDPNFSSGVGEHLELQTKSADHIHFLGPMVIIINVVFTAC